MSRFETVREWATFDFGRQQDPACLAVVLAPDKAASALSAIRAAIPAGTVAFRTANETEIVVGPGQDQFDILRLARTSAPNSNLSTEQIIEHLQRLDERVGINIVRAESDRVDFNLNSQPQDIQAFAESIYEFCPDVVDQALGSLDMLIMQIDIASYVWLWWD